MSNDDERTIWLKIPVSRETEVRLRTLSAICGVDPQSVASSLLHDILKDDEDHHYLLEAPPASNTVN